LGQTMMTLRQLMTKHETMPSFVSWYLADLGESRGKQELFTRQSPQRLKTLREHALIESAVSSNRIEGVEVDHKRIGTIIFGKPRLRDRNEEELRGYREALKLVHEKGPGLPISEKTMLSLHSLTRGAVWDAGKYKDKNSDIIEKQPNGTSQIRFRALPAKSTPAAVSELVSLWKNGLRERRIHPAVLMAAFNLDFLCIHPFRDGNGRVSRLLLLLQCYHVGFEVGRYVSLERLIEENKERYYEALNQSSQGWHEGRNDPWPYIGFVLFTLKTAYKEFEERLGRVSSPRGAKTEMVESAVVGFKRPFTLADLERACPGVSRDMVRRVLRRLQKTGRTECLGRGPGATWQNKGSTSKKG